MVGSKHLKLVIGAPGGAGSGYQIVSLEQIGAAEREKLKQAVSEIAPDAGIVGVMRGSRTWDLRPVLMLFGESGPALLRFLGPEVALSKTVTKNTEQMFSRLTNAEKSVVRFGKNEGQLWYRRPLYEDTLAQLVSEQAAIDPRLAFSLARSIVNQVVELHNRGIVHGHITSTNIGLGSDGHLSLMDSGVAVAIVQATRELGIENFPQGYEMNTFAPELLGRRTIAVASYSADLFGLGLVLKDIFSSALKGACSGEDEFRDKVRIVPADLQHMIEHSERLTSPEASRRGNLVELLEVIGNFGRPKSMGIKPFPDDSFIHVIEPVETPSENVSESKATLDEVKRFVSREESSAQKENTGDSAPHNGEERKKKGRTDYVSTSIWPIVATLSLLLFGFYFFMSVREQKSVDTRVTSPMTVQDLRVAWESGLPSRMSIVAVRAIDKKRIDQTAEDIIIRSAFSQEKVSGVDVEMIRVAFDKRWERNLTAVDRRTALALAMAELLGPDMPHDLADLRALHPGVILAIAASAGESVQRLLDQVPASVLRNLPIPFGIAFGELLSVNPNLMCGDLTVIALAKMAAYGTDNPENVREFLSDLPSVSIRLRALAQLSSQDNSKARGLIATLLAHPNLTIQNPNIIWAKRYRLYDWQELESTDQLFLLAGIPPAGQISGSNLAKLFSHPDPLIRKESISQAIDKINFAHPGALAVLSELKKNPLQLDSGPTVRLMQILIGYRSIGAEAVRKFMDTKPPVNLVSLLLQGTAKEKSAAPVDLEAIRYLKEMNWAPTLDEAEKLLTHPDDLTRVFIYRQIFNAKDHERAVKLLLAARKQEQNPQFAAQLREMIELIASDQ